MFAFSLEAPVRVEVETRLRAVSETCSRLDSDSRSPCSFPDFAPVEVLDDAAEVVLEFEAVEVPLVCDPLVDDLLPEELFDDDDELDPELLELALCCELEEEFPVWVLFPLRVEVPALDAG